MSDPLFYMAGFVLGTDFPSSIGIGEWLFEQPRYKFKVFKTVRRARSAADANYSPGTRYFVRTLKLESVLPQELPPYYEYKEYFTTPDNSTSQLKSV